MALGLYFHIPYCIQKCHYCDFTTFSLDHEVSMKSYTQAILRELHVRSPFINKKLNYKQVSSIYFGGGTPSLLPAQDILSIREEIARVGFEILPNAECTIEINPGTIDEQKLDLYLAAGVNRYSVGVQTFNDPLLKHCGREHSADDSRRTLDFCKQRNLNFSFDLLFGLPHQNWDVLRNDLTELASYAPNHVSLYNLNIPHAHFMNQNRPDDDDQVQMFNYIETELHKIGLSRYELSNFARPGFESQHNLIYWSDGAYWGLGVSAHSYLPNFGRWGARFWNAKHHKHYLNQLDALASEDVPFFMGFPQQQFEELECHEALTDYCHTQLRVLRGLSLPKLEAKFGPKIRQIVQSRVDKLLVHGLLSQANPDSVCLSTKGIPLANQVFLELTFLASEI